MQNVSRRPLLDDAAQIQNGDAGTEIARHAKIVGDEDQRQAHFAAESAQEVEQLCLHRDIQASNGFVRDDRLGFSSKSARHRHAANLAP